MNKQAYLDGYLSKKAEAGSSPIVGVGLGAPSVAQDRSETDLKGFQMVFPGKTWDDTDEINSSGDLSRWLQRVRAYDTARRADPSLDPGGEGWFDSATVQAVLAWEQRKASKKA